MLELQLNVGTKGAPEFQSAIDYQLISPSYVKNVTACHSNEELGLVNANHNLLLRGLSFDEYHSWFQFLFDFRHKYYVINVFMVPC